MSIVGRYVASLLLVRTAVLLFGLAALMLILELLADADQVIAASGAVVRPLLYYSVLRLPEIFAEVIPISVFLAGLLSFAHLARHSELAALYAAGISKPRLAIAVLPVGIVIAALQFLIQDQAVPRAAIELRAWGVGDYGSHRDAPTWLRQGDDITRIERVDEEGRQLTGVRIFRRDADGNFLEEIAADRARYQHGGWVLQGVSRSSLATLTVDTYGELPWNSQLDPGLVVSLVGHPKRMGLMNLFRVVELPKLGAQPGFRYRVWLQERIAAPLTTILLILMTVAMARPHTGRSGRGLSIAIGIAVGFLSWTFDTLLLTFGDLGLVPPFVAAWAPVPVFATVALSIGVHEGPAARIRRPDRRLFARPNEAA